MFDINEIINRFNPDLDEMASVLFPSAKYKTMAFNRLIRYESVIDVEQLIKLAAYLNVEVSDLFTGTTKTSNRVNNKIVFDLNGYTIKMFTDNYYYSIYKGDTLVVNVVDDLTRLSLIEFTETVNKQINNYGHQC